MSVKPTFKWFSAEQLIAAAGGDPWEIAEQLHAGDPGAIDGLAAAFHDAGVRVKDADDEFAKARQQFLDSYDRNNGAQHPINDAAEVQRVRAQLAAHPEELTRIAADLEQTAAALATAQRDSAAEISELNAALHDIDAEIDSHGIEIPMFLTELVGEAEDQTAASLGHLQNVQGAYVDQLRSAEAAMVASGYAPTALADADAVANNSPTEAADEYKKSGQLDRDRATVEKAAALHPNGQLGWNIDEVQAQRRLDDYAAITDPTNKDTSPIWFASDQEKAESQFLAGERLDDFNVANSVGPVARDPILGGDMRDRARARLTMQRQLEDGQLGWHPTPMQADEATKLMDQLEVQDRTAALARLQEQLIANNVSPEGAEKVADAFAHGIIPKEFVDETKTLGQSSEVTARGAEGLGKVLIPGDALGLELSQADIDSLGEIGKKLGHVSNALEVGVGLYEWASGEKTLTQATMGVAGSLAGAWLLGEGGAALGAPAGPVGVFVLGAAGAVTGGFVGEKGANKVYEYLTGGGS